MDHCETMAVDRTGPERAFAAGADVKEMAELGLCDVYFAYRLDAWDDFARHPGRSSPRSRALSLAPSRRSRCCLKRRQRVDPRGARVASIRAAPGFRHR